MKNNSKNNSLNLNINKDDGEINDFIFCWNEFGTRPNKLILHSTYNTDKFEDVMFNRISTRNSVSEYIQTESDFIINEKILGKISDEIWISYLILDKNYEDSLISELTFYYNGEENQVQIVEMISELGDCVLDFCEKETNNLNTITISTNGLDIEPIECNNFDLENFELFYTKKTFKESNKLIKQLKKSETGLSVIWGEKGTGKTKFISYLANKLDRIVIYIPISMLDHTLFHQDFRKYLKKFDKPILVIDDCELLWKDFTGKGNSLTTSILQLVDGFIPSSVNIITLFNVENENEIDEKLLDCNNLVSVVEFNWLTKDEASDLSEYLGNNKKFKSECRVLDVVKNNKVKQVEEIGL